MKAFPPWLIFITTALVSSATANFPPWILYASALATAATSTSAVTFPPWILYANAFGSVASASFFEPKAVTDMHAVCLDLASSDGYGLGQSDWLAAFDWNLQDAYEML